MSHDHHHHQRPVAPPPQLHFDDGSRAMMTTMSLDEANHFKPHPHQQQDHQQGGGNGNQGSLLLSNNSSSRDTSIDIATYYELDRWTQEICTIVYPRKITTTTTSSTATTTSTTTTAFKVALQFPDDLLPDAPDVCWQLEDSIQQELELRRRGQQQEDELPFVLIFVLGDTTVASCCPDIVAAQHLQADLLIHYGPACWSSHYHQGGGGGGDDNDEDTEHDTTTTRTTDHHVSTTTTMTTTTNNNNDPYHSSKVPIVGYSLGCPPFHVSMAVQTILHHLKNGHDHPSHLPQQQQSQPQALLPQKILILYDPIYHGHINELQTSLLHSHHQQQQEHGGKELLIVAGQVPAIALHSPSLQWSNSRPLPPTSSHHQEDTTTSPCCGGGGSSSGGGCQSNRPMSTNHAKPKKDESPGLPAPEAAAAAANDESSSDNLHGTTERFHHQDRSTVAHRLHRRRPLVLGGLELPDTITSWDQLSDFIILYISNSYNNNINNTDGDNDDSSPPSETTTSPQHVTILLRLLSLPNPPQQFWTYTPPSSNNDTTNVGTTTNASPSMVTTTTTPPPSTSRCLLSTTVPRIIQQQLKRRFYLTQKARSARVFGLLVNSHVTHTRSDHVAQMIGVIQRRIQQQADCACYILAVGKITPAKLANFADLECFVLLSCEQTSLLQHERDYHVPVITPLELEIALGTYQWGEQVYSLQVDDTVDWTGRGGQSLLQQQQQQHKNQEGANDQNDEDFGDAGDEDDAPYFSLVTGQYEASRSKWDPVQQQQQPLNLQTLPGQGQVLVYQSEAANFLKQRDYQGLEPQLGQTEARPATLGQVGIASDYEGI
jgi:diphthamide synthase subunit DPH2